MTNPMKTMATTITTTAMLTLAACSTPPATPTEAPSSSSAAPTADTVLDHISWLHSRADLTAARTALRAGKPFLIGLPDRGTEACHTALLLPGDPTLWIMNRIGAAPTRGIAADRIQHAYGCTSHASPAATTKPTSEPLDTAARDRALAAGKPYIYATPGCDPSTTITSVALPNGTSWTTNRAGAAPAEGIALSDVQHSGGCSTETSPSPKRTAKRRPL